MKLGLTQVNHPICCVGLKDLRMEDNSVYSGHDEPLIHTLTSVGIFSILFSLRSQGADKENLFNNRERL